MNSKRQKILVKMFKLTRTTTVLAFNALTRYIRNLFRTPSLWRGHLIIKRGDLWYYVDDGSPVAGNERTCGKCDQPAPLNGVDPCLGMLPRVVNACCGHGEPEEAYIQFENGVRISGFTNVKQPCPKCKDKDILYCSCLKKGTCKECSGTGVIAAGTYQEVKCGCKDD